MDYESSSSSSSTPKPEPLSHSKVHRAVDAVVHPGQSHTRTVNLGSSTPSHIGGSISSGMTPLARQVNQSPIIVNGHLHRTKDGVRIANSGAQVKRDYTPRQQQVVFDGDRRPIFVNADEPIVVENRNAFHVDRVLTGDHIQRVVGVDGRQFDEYIHVGGIADSGIHTSARVVSHNVKQGDARLVHVQGETLKRSKVINVPVVHKETRIPVEVEVPVEVPVEVRVPVHVPYPVEKIVEIREEILQEKIVQVDVPVTVEVPTPYEQIIEKLIEQVVQVVGPTRIVEKLVEVPRVVEVHTEVEIVNEVEVPYPVEHIREKIIEQPVPVERQVFVHEEYIVEKIIPVEIEKIIEKIVKIPEPVERIIENVIEEPYDVVQYRDVPVPVEHIREKVIHVHVDNIVEVPVEKIVTQVQHVEVPYDKIVEKIVRVPREIIREVTVEIPIEKIIEQIVRVPVEKIIEKIVHVPIEKIVEVRVEEIVEKIVEVPVEKIIEKIIRIPEAVGGPEIIGRRHIRAPPRAVRWVQVPETYIGDEFYYDDYFRYSAAPQYFYDDYAPEPVFMDNSYGYLPPPEPYFVDEGFGYEAAPPLYVDPYARGPVRRDGFYHTQGRRTGPPPPLPSTRGSPKRRLPWRRNRQ